MNSATATSAPPSKDAMPPSPALAADSAVAAAAQALLREQRGDGCWEGEMVWCTMILSQYVITQRVLRRDIPPERVAGMIRHYEVTRTPDGGWGLHGESGAYVFTTTLAYVALRALGLSPDHPLCATARAWLRSQPGGVLSVPTWGKLWLSLVGLYEWDGVNPFPPELFLLPEALPLHPDRYYCHTRYIYLAIAALYGARARFDLGADLTDALRRELYDRPYAQINFAAHRHDLAKSDLYVRPSAALRLAYEALRGHERLHNRALRQRALRHCMTRIRYEQRATRYQGISPVNGLLNCLALARSADPEDRAELEPSLAGVEAWRWEDPAEGVRYAGARSNAWDTAFSLQALTDALPRCGEAQRPALYAAMRRGYAYLRDTQLREDLPGADVERRAPLRGGWCFSDGQHRWPVSDCTAEALSALLGLHEAAAATPDLLEGVARVPEPWLVQAACFILQRQNKDGGFGSYEARRGGALLELINPSEMYGSCMTERSYLECTASCVEALCRFRALLPGRIQGIDDAIARGVVTLRAGQERDGGFPGFWGINYTYGAFHVVRALRAAGVPPEDPALQAAARWLVAHQKPDGSFGEHYTGCLEGRYIEHPEGQVVMTSWALLALTNLLPRDAAPIQRAATWLRRAQTPDGGFPQQAQNGVFFGTAMLDYRLYKSYFPLWALSHAPPMP